MNTLERFHIYKLFLLSLYMWNRSRVFMSSPFLNEWMNLESKYLWTHHSHILLSQFRESTICPTRKWWHSFTPRSCVQTHYFQVQVILRPSVSLPVVQESGTHLGPMTRFLLLQGIFGLNVVGRPSWREDGSVICSYNSLSFLGPSPAELMTTSYCLISDSPNLEGQVTVFIFPRSRVASYIPWHWLPFLSPLTTRRATVVVFYPASTRGNALFGWWSDYINPAWTAYKAPRFVQSAILLWLVNLSLRNSFYPVLSGKCPFFKTPRHSINIVV
jgi:hypothetical protein